MEFALLGWPADGPTLNLDHREFSYAGKFVMSNTGKAVARERTASGDSGAAGDADAGETARIVAAAAFNEDRTDGGVCWIRYVTVRRDRRGEGIGPRLIAFVVDRIADRGYDRARIAVNNPFAYQALYRAGFRFTGEETGMAELVLDRPLSDASDAAHGRRSRETYQAGLDIFRERDLSDAEEAYLDEKRGTEPPKFVGTGD